MFWCLTSSLRDNGFGNDVHALVRGHRSQDITRRQVNWTGALAVGQEFTLGIEKMEIL